ncbi:MAG TPA: permease, partial [Pilimelia sp.]|nr:permease [Pilimelia sp.]
MPALPCPSCGRPADPTLPCPSCGADAGGIAAELARVEREISELSRQDVAMQVQRTQLSKRMQAAMHRRALLANAQDERSRHATTKQKRSTGRRRPPRVPPTRHPRPIPRPAPEAFSDAVPPPPVPGDEHPQVVRPEQSTRSVQNILLALGALLLGVAAVVFAGVAISTLDDLSRATILIVATLLMLLAPPAIARRGLTATAETLAAVGLLLVPLDGYALWEVEQLHRGAIPGTVFAGLVFAASAAIAGAYASSTGLAVPRYATLLALQPILPLMAYEAISGPGGWALVLTVVAMMDLALARALPTHLAAWARPGSAPAA